MPEALRLDRRGASLVEYILLVGAVALVAIAGYRAFGRVVDADIRRDAECVAALDPGCGDPTNKLTSAHRGSAGRGDPGLTAEPPFRGSPVGVAYGPYKGMPFVAGAGDGADIHPNDVSQ